MILAQELRGQCKCAHCIEEFTGKKLIKRENIPHNIQPTHIQTVGNYATGIEWNDGHTSLYSHKLIKDLSKNKEKILS